MIAAARKAFEAEGSGFSVDDVVALAGVGVGTFYRHFRSKTALLDAMIAELLDDLSRLIAPEVDAADAIFAFVHGALRSAPAKLDLVEALESLGNATELQQAIQRLRQQVRGALENAQEAGTITSDVNTDDLLALVSAGMTASARSADQPLRAERIAAVLCDGLRTRDQGTRSA
ncbi:TetR/AcrR family transcriptional regulator [Planctomonas sp. JC2975]|uniref:TetR/AcrR family transcriptional regulator n=1 Tax=Planctomonas sp. JC2975 TaxID=2729626 RepID=UPI001F0E1045|nr:TetR/AcrR family transcriptional regulator [Planctomonas sp. JC2975]